ncbi:hypothetical protein DXG01_005978 [Tephrocybe rancida]|nr:hypothetical protein DXG01_005978 [Tephrocybe rancida]
MACLLQEYSRQALDNPANELNVWHAVLRSAANKKYIPYAPEAMLFPPISSLPVADQSVATAVTTTFASAVAGSVAGAGAGVGATPVATSVGPPVVALVAEAVANCTPTTVAAPPAVSAPPTTSTPIPATSAKVRTAVITATGHCSHGQKKLAPGVIPGATNKGTTSTTMSGTEKVQRPPVDKVKGQAGKLKPNPEEDGRHIDGVHAIPCPNCVSHKQECERHVGKDNKVGKGKKLEEGASDVPKKAKAKPKQKVPITPKYVTDDDEESLAPPAPFQSQPA